MAVYEHRYKPYTGELTPSWSRFLIIPHHAYKDIFQSKIFMGFFVFCFMYPLACAILIYLHHNTTALEILDLKISHLIAIDNNFFYWYVFNQGMLAFLLNLYIGPALVARDINNNAMPLYLCRPFSRAEYIIGKMSVLFFLLSAFTWIPGLLLFLLQCYLVGRDWMMENLFIAKAIFLGSLAWIMLQALLAQAVSAWVKWRLAASAALLGLFFIPIAMAEIIRESLETHWGQVISSRGIIRTLWGYLFQKPERMELPIEGAVISLIAICLLCLFLLSRKVRAYEVIK